ncbi:oxygenase MpaB family protein [Amycolatopsis nigrescens]|uniref:oxygenase MpaB family protein n=1 Tax=Amycolatopsis nigrescens TaxID=381445 RepID=UPI00036A58FB|nr:oxygenase MpaB family protein [Amycolatopsis nigrescens]
MVSTRPASRPVREPRPREDHGFFGPDSPTWRVWTHPTAVLGFQRAIVVETFDPFLTAAVHDQNGVRRDPAGRLRRTFDYFVTVAVGDSRTAIEASEILMKVHARAVGTEPVSGLPYDANDPDSQLWIHVTGWQSNLLMYERYGPGPLSEEDEQRYWQECVIAAELQTCDPAKVPRSRADVRDYYATMRPRLCATDRQRALVEHFLRTPFTRETAKLWAGSRIVAPAVVATIPRWMRRLGGFDQWRLTDAAIGPMARAATRFFTPIGDRLEILDQFAPSTRRIIEPALRGEKPLNPVTRTPAEARAKYGRTARTAVTGLPATAG